MKNQKTPRKSRKKDSDFDNIERQIPISQVKIGQFFRYPARKKVYTMESKRIGTYGYSCTEDASSWYQTKNKSRLVEVGFEF